MKRKALKTVLLLASIICMLVIASFSVACSNVETELDDLKTEYSLKITTLTEKCDEMESDITKLISDLVTLENMRSDIETAIEEAEERIFELENPSDGVDYSAAIEVQKQRIDVLRGELFGVDGEITKAKADIATLKTAVTELQTETIRIAAIIGDVTDLSGDLNGLNTRISALENYLTDLALLKSTYSTMQQDVSTLNAAKTDLTNRVIGLESQVTALEQNGEDMEEIREETAKIAALLQEIEDIDGTIKSINKKLDNFESFVTDATKDINELKSTAISMQKDISLIKGNMASLDSRVNALDIRVTALEDRFKEISDTDALAAALGAQIIETYYTLLDDTMNPDIYGAVRSAAYYHAFYIMRSQNSAEAHARFEEAVTELDELVNDPDAYKWKYNQLFNTLNILDYSSANWASIQGIKSACETELITATVGNMPDYEGYVAQIAAISRGWQAYIGVSAEVGVRYGTIQAAIDGANAGETIVFKKATLEVVGGLRITKNLTINGNGATILMTAQASLFATLQYPVWDGAPSRPVYAIIGINNGATVTINDLAIDGGNYSYQTALGIIGVANVTVNSLTTRNLSRITDGSSYGYGVIVDGNASVSVFDSDIGGFSKGGLYCLIGTLNIENTMIRGAGISSSAAQNGIWYFEGSKGSVTDVTIFDIAYYNPSAACSIGLYIETSLVVTYSNVNSVNTDVDIVDYKNNYAQISSVTGLAYYATDAESGMTINLVKGTYRISAGLVFINDVIINGNGSTVIMTQTAGVFAAASFNASRIAYAIVGIKNNANVTLNNLIIDGGRFGSQTAVCVIDGAKVTLNNVTTQNLYAADYNGMQHGWAMLVDGIGSVANINNCTLGGFSKGGIYCVRGELNINNSSILGIGHNAIAAQNGIWYFAGTSGSVQNTTFSDLMYYAGGAAATGLYSDSLAVTVERDTLTFNNVDTYYNLVTDEGRLIKAANVKSLVSLFEDLNENRDYSNEGMTVIELLPIKYLLNGRYTIKGDLTLVGAGADKTELLFSPHTYGLQLLEINAVIIGVSFNLTEYTGTILGLLDFDNRVGDDKTYLFSDCKFNAAKGGLTVRGGSGIIEKCVFTTFDTSAVQYAVMTNLLQIDFSTEVTIIDCGFYGNGLSVMPADEADDNYIYGILVCRGGYIESISDCTFDELLTAGIVITNAWDSGGNNTVVQPQDIAAYKELNFYADEIDDILVYVS